MGFSAEAPSTLSWQTPGGVGAMRGQTGSGHVASGCSIDSPIFFQGRGGAQQLREVWHQPQQHPEQQQQQQSDVRKKSNLVSDKGMGGQVRCDPLHLAMRQVEGKLSQDYWTIVVDCHLVFGVETVRTVVLVSD